MSRLLQYINESGIKDFTNDISTAKTLIKRDCSPYLKLMKGREALMKGLSGSYLEGLLGIKKTRNERMARISSPKVSKIFNKWLEDNGHIRRDKNVVICSSRKNNIFGKQYYIYPIGKINYTWIKSLDFNWKNKIDGWDPIHILPKTARDGMVPLDIPQNIFYTNENFNIAYENGYEIWFKCDKYYITGNRELKYTKI